MVYKLAYKFIYANHARSFSRSPSKNSGLTILTPLRILRPTFSISSYWMRVMTIITVKVGAYI